MCECNINDPLVIEPGNTFLLNAGICGFITALENYGAESDKDYCFEGNNLIVSKEYLLNTDLSQLYIEAVVSCFKNDSKFKRMTDLVGIIENITNKGELSKEDEKQLKEYYKTFTDYFESNSRKAGFEILKSENIEKPVSIETISEIKKEKDYNNKLLLLKDFNERISQKKVKEVLLMKEIMYTKINLFYEGISFFLPANLKKSINECYNTDFVQPLIEMISDKENKGKKRCIECNRTVKSTRSISFMVDTTDDVNRKKSYYWNQKPDAFVCPLCAFLYTFVPMGFMFAGQEALFINSAQSIKTMCQIMNSYKTKLESDEKSSQRSRLFRVFTTDEIDMLEKKIDNIEVVTRGASKNNYSMYIFDKMFVEKLKEGKNDLKYLEKIYVKFTDFESVYDMVIDNILAGRNQYSLMHKLLINALGENKNTNYLKNILNIQIIFKGGENMEELKELADKAFGAGTGMRKAVVGDVGKDTDNHLRGIVYKLSNAVAVGDREMFLDSVIRIYSGRGMAMPYIFKCCFDSEEAFKTIGQAYILGLKYEKYESNNDNKED